MSNMFANYKILSELGRGGFGVVYKAIAPDEKIVALKVVDFESIVSDRELFKKMYTRFSREAEAGRKIVHPNVVRSYTQGNVNKKFYLVSEFVDGYSLLQRIKSEPQLSLDQTLNIFMKILHGLNAIHRCGMIHRDIKPANILLTKGEEVKIADLGLVKSNVSEEVRTIITATGAVLGTPNYMSPEQIAGDKNIDIRTDLYSLGVLLFECLAGFPPYRCESGEIYVKILYQHVNSPIPEIREHRPDVSANISHLIKSLMQKKAQDRPANPQEVLDMVMHYPTMGDKGVAASPRVEIDVDDKFHTTLSEISKRPQDEVEANATLDIAKPNVTEKEMFIYAVTPFTDTKTNKKRLSRAKLIIRNQKSTRTLFVYATSCAILGRNSMDLEGQTICLRPLEDAANKERAMAISGKHFSLIIEDGEVKIMDLESRGTSLDENPLHSFIPYKLSNENVIGVANSLKLKSTIFANDDVVRKIAIIHPGDNKPNVLGAVKGNQKGILLSRLDDCKEHFYAIVPRILKLKITSENIFPHPNGELEIMNWAGYLWLCGRNQQQDVCKPLLEGDFFNLAGCQVHISQINIEDQKGLS